MFSSDKSNDDGGSKMKSYEDLLVKWRAKRTNEDVKQHLNYHLDEVKELLAKHDDHRFDEMIDLTILIRLYLDFNDKHSSRIMNRRMKKFNEKIDEVQQETKIEEEVKQ